MALADFLIARPDRASDLYSPATLPGHGPFTAATNAQRQKILPQRRPEPGLYALPRSSPAILIMGQEPSVERLLFLS